MLSTHSLHLDDGDERDRPVHVGERFGRVAQLFVVQWNVQQRLVDVEQQQLADVRIEALDSGRPLCSGAAVDETFVGQFDAAGGAGVLAGGERLRPAVGVGEVEDHHP